jgi:hypothetical protein
VVTDPAPDQKTSPPGARRPVAMTPYAIAVALFAAFVVGGILGKVIPLWLVAVLGLGVPAQDIWTDITVLAVPALSGLVTPRRSLSPYWRGLFGLAVTRATLCLIRSAGAALASMRRKGSIELDRYRYYVYSCGLDREKASPYIRTWSGPYVLRTRHSS